METRVVKIDEKNIDAAAIKEAARVLDAGGLVAFPTETVYGIGCRVSADSLARLDRVKGRPAEKYYTLHIAKPGDVAKYVPVVGLQAKKLIKNGWPGPLTIVFELDEGGIAVQKRKLSAELFVNLYRDSSIGIRCPDSRIASALLAEAKNAIVAPSANISGQPAAVEAKEVIERFAGQIEMVIDGGLCPHRINSTVVKVTNLGLSVLRDGVYSEAQVLEMATVTILFVCTGNSCRSPMAEGLFKKYLAERLGCGVDALSQRGYNVTSAGTMGITGFPATGQAIRACADRGVDITGHRSRGLSRYLIEQSDIIYALADGHRNAVIEISPETGDKSAAADKCLLLDEGTDITDPIGRPQEVYDECAGLIDRAVKKRISELVL